MRKLIVAEIKRYISSLYYLVVLIALFLFHVFKIEGRIYFIYIHWGNGFLDNMNFICIVLSILTSIYIGEEFSNHTIQNKIYLGYRKSQIYISETIACALGGGSLVLFDSLFNLLTDWIRSSKVEYSISFIIFNTLIFMIVIGTISTIICSLSFLIKRRFITLILLIFIAIFLINNGRRSLALLTDYESFFVEANEENDPASKDLMETFTGELSEKQRKQLNMRITFSPYAQCNYSTYITTETPEEKPQQSLWFKDCKYHIDFVLVDLIFSSLFVAICVNIFKRQNI